METARDEADTYRKDLEEKSKQMLKYGDERSN